MLLFLGLFRLAVRYVHTYPLPIPADQQQILIGVARMLKVQDYEFLYIASMLAIDAIVAGLVSWGVVRLWRRCTARADKRPN